MRRRWLLLALALVSGLAIFAAPGLAHGELLRSVPEANAVLNRSPAQIQLYFSEAPEASFSFIKVFDSGGARVDVDDSRVDPADPRQMRVSLRSLPDGVYTVSWQVLSTVDGHVTAGAFPFAVGNVDAAALAAAQASRTIKLFPGEIVARWLTYLALASLLGGLLFSLLVWQPAVRVEATDPAPPALWRRLARFALLIFALAQLLALLVQAGQAVGAELAPPWSPAVGQMLFSTRYGALWLARLALILALVGLLPATPGTRWPALVAALLLPLTLSLGSHAAAEARPLLPVLADGLHLAAVSAWIGGLIYFVAGLVAATRRLDLAGQTRLTARLIPRFSALALFSVGLLLATGVYSASLRLGTFAALTGTWYGRALLLKLAIAGPMLLLGAVNLFITRPAMKRAAAQAGGQRSLLARFRRLIAAEAILGGAVLLSVGLLAALPPPQLGATPTALDFSTEVDDLSLALNITPGRVGLNTFTVAIASDGRPLEQAKEVALRFTPTTVNVPPSQAQLIARGNGQYSLKGAYLSLPDAWQVQVVVRRQDKFDAFANFNVDIRPAAAPSYAWPQINGVLVLILAAAYGFAVSNLGRTRRQWLGWGLVPALLLVWGGLILLSRPPARAEAGPVNPIPPNPASVSAGQTLYEQNCLVCHGPTGLGDGRVGLTLNPRPADLTRHTIPGVHPDGQLYLWISDGFPGSVMPAFRNTLTDEERWHVVNYIRTLAVAGNRLDLK